jgi:hypothetical protein
VDGVGVALTNAARMLILLSTCIVYVLIVSQQLRDTLFFYPVATFTVISLHCDYWRCGMFKQQHRLADCTNAEVTLTQNTGVDVTEESPD